MVLNDKSIKRITILKSNLNRLKFNTKIINSDFVEFDNKTKYDVIIIDAPCSAIGTIRRNPEILFKMKEPNFKKLNSIQKKMLDKASNLLNKNGYIIYMTCSFLKDETEDQVNNFLKKNKNFELCNFEKTIDNLDCSKILKKNFMITLPDHVLNYKIDGYFAASIKKLQ